MLQLRSAPIDTRTVLILIALGLCIVALILYVYLYQFFKRKFNIHSLKDHNINKHTFKTLGISVGLIPEEIKMLLNLVVNNNIKAPYTCFTNIKVLDGILKKGFHEINHKEELEDTDRDQKIAMLFEIKAKIEANSKSNAGISSTHLVEVGQKMILFIKGKGYYYLKVLRNTHQSLLVELMSEKITRRLLAKGEYLKVYFWREGDAGYIFESSVISQQENVRSFEIKHSDHLLRTQKRKYRRIPVNIRGNYYPIHSIVEGGKKKFSIKAEEIHPCTIVNLSAGGVRMELIDDSFDERYRKEKLLKIEFSISRHECSVIGKIIRQHHFKNGKYDLTIQFVKISTRDKNSINEKVYDYLPGY
jgi:c-di-GMP-binding flagellar brake protein YcgR